MTVVSMPQHVAAFGAFAALAIKARSLFSLAYKILSSPAVQRTGCFCSVVRRSIERHVSTLRLEDMDVFLTDPRCNPRSHGPMRSTSVLRTLLWKGFISFSLEPHPARVPRLLTGTTADMSWECQVFAQIHPDKGPAFSGPLARLSSSSGRNMS
eukprot:1157926-Pelagomonas_calceolata.AAC.5